MGLDHSKSQQIISMGRAYDSVSTTNIALIPISSHVSFHKTNDNIYGSYIPHFTSCTILYPIIYWTLIILTLFASTLFPLDIELYIQLVIVSCIVALNLLISCCFIVCYGSYSTYKKDKFLKKVGLNENITSDVMEHINFDEMTKVHNKLKIKLEGTIRDKFNGNYNKNTTTFEYELPFMQSSINSVEIIEALNQENKTNRMILIEFKKRLFFDDIKGWSHGSFKHFKSAVGRKYNFEPEMYIMDHSAPRFDKCTVHYKHGYNVINIKYGPKHSDFLYNNMELSPSRNTLKIFRTCCIYIERSKLFQCILCFIGLFFCRFNSPIWFGCCMESKRNERNYLIKYTVNIIHKIYSWDQKKRYFNVSRFARSILGSDAYEIPNVIEDICADFIGHDYKCFKEGTIDESDEY